MSEPVEDDYIGIGDIVEHKMNTAVFGIVIGLAGSLVYVRTSPTLAILSFHEWELQMAEKVAPPDDKLKQPTPDNVIRVDFTKGRSLTKDTKTEGAA
jgi:hypothetical protein